MTKIAYYRSLLKQPFWKSSSRRQGQAQPPLRKPLSESKSAEDPSEFRKMVLIFLLALIPLFIFGPISEHERYLMERMAKDPPPVFTVLTTLQFEQDEHRAQFYKDVQPLCEYVKKRQHDTLAYEVLRSDTNPRVVTMVERYPNKKEAYLKRHRTSLPYLEFAPKLRAMQDAGQVTVSRESYWDTQLGFPHREIQFRKQRRFNRLLTLKFKGRKHVDQFLTDIKPVCDNADAREPDTVAYKVLKSETNKLLLTIMERYNTKDDILKHDKSAPYMEFSPKLKAMQDAGYVVVEEETYGESGFGFADRVQNNTY